MQTTMPKLEARVRPFAGASGKTTRLVAFAELVIADAFVIRGLRVLQSLERGDEEPFVVFPAERGKGESADRWFDVAHPVTAEARAAATAVVLERWRQAGPAPARA